MKCSILRQNALMIHSTILVFLHVPLFNCQYLMQLHMILDEMISGGQVIETSSEQIMKSVEEIERFSPLPSFHILSALLCLMLISMSITWHRLEKQSSSTSFIPKSITERFTRWASTRFQNNVTFKVWTELRHTIQSHFSSPIRPCMAPAPRLYSVSL